MIQRGKGAVLHVLSNFDFGGVESRMLLLAQSQEQSRFEHLFCALGTGGAASEHMRSEGHSLHVFGLDTKVPSMRALARLAWLFFRAKPDFVHCHGVEANVHGGLVSWLAGIPFACEEVGIPEHSKLARIVMRFVYQKSQVVMAVSSETKKAIIELGEAKESKILVIDSPAKLATRAVPARASGQPYRLAFVGRLEPVKNPLASVDALNLLNSEGISCSLLIVGDGSMRATVENRVRELGLASKVTMAGFVPNPIEYLGAVDFFVQPSLSEGLSIALIEAMAAEIPPVITGRGGGPEIVQEGVNGWILESVEPHAIASKFKELVRLSDSEILRVGRQARKTVEHRFGVSRYIESLDSVYLKFVGQKS